MTRIHLPLLQFSIVLIVFGLTACNTPEQKPYTPPQTQAQRPPPPPEMQSRREQEQPAQTASGQQPTTEPRAAPTETAAMEAAEPVADPDRNEALADDVAADVEITDIPVDEDGNPIVEQSKTGVDSRRPQSATSTSRPAGGGGGRPTPNYGQRDDSAGGTTGGTPRIEGVDTGPVINRGAQTDAERLAALDRDLEGKLAKFDELMRRAREEAEQERAAGGGGTGAGNGGRLGGAEDGRGAREVPPPDGRGAGGHADTSSGLGHTPDVTGSKHAGEFKYANTGPIPIDIPDARDDDIVARQLREAATHEADPVLREKLWDEYRKYKKGIGR